jgi:uncharacterized protein YkwD
VFSVKHVIMADNHTRFTRVFEPYISLKGSTFMLTHKSMALTLSATLLFSGVVLATETSTATVASAAVSQSELNSAVTLILNQTNEARAQAGLAPLRLNSDINTVAQNWSQAMSDNGSMTHNPNYSRQIPAGWYGAAENVAYGYSVDRVTAAWMNSEGHRRNILGNYTDIGIGFYKDSSGTTWFTQNFARYSTSYTPPAPTPTPTPTTEPKPAPAPTTEPKPAENTDNNASTEAPQNVTSSTNDSAFRVNWKEPAYTGKIVRYTIQLTNKDGYDRIFQSLANTVAFTGLQAGTEYTATVKVVVTSVSGTKTVEAQTSTTNRTTGTAPAPTPTPAPTTPAPAPTTPAPAPETSAVTVSQVKNIAVKTADTAVRISWSAPDVVGGKISKYSVTVKNDVGFNRTYLTTGTEVVAAGLPTGTVHTVDITAEAVSTDGKTKNTSLTSTTATTGGQVAADQVAISPVRNIQTFTNTSAVRVTWEKPATMTGTLTRYTITLKSGDFSRTFNSLAETVSFTGLDKNREYQVVITATATSESKKATATSTEAVANTKTLA